MLRAFWNSASKRVFVNSSFSQLNYRYVQSDQRAFYFIEKAVDQSHPGALYLLGAVYLTGDCANQDVSSAIWCFHRASEKDKLFTTELSHSDFTQGHAGAAIAYGSLLLRGVEVPESITRFNGKNRKSRKLDKSNNPLELARRQFKNAAKAGNELGFEWLNRLEQEEKRLLDS